LHHGKRDAAAPSADLVMKMECMILWREKAATVGCQKRQTLVTGQYR
jgi:hypothetical protein